MERAGGRVGELVLKIDGRDAHGLKMEEVVDLLRGDEGTTVSLVLGASPDSARTLVITRGPVLSATLATLSEETDVRSNLRVEPHIPIAYVKIRQINGSTVHDLRRLERHFQSDEIQGVILDLRSEGAHDLHHTLLLADALLDGGLIGRVRRQGHVQEYHADRECLFRDLPLAVLVNQETRGGAEWIAAALQDNHAAVIVGERTAGQARIHEFVPLPGDLGALQLNTGIFERPSGRSIERVISSNTPPFSTRRDRRVTSGVIPDLPKERPTGPEHSVPAGALWRQFLDRAKPERDDESESLRLAFRELRTRLDAGKGRTYP
jgi:carboxyl-terminal processing protease